MRREGSAPLEFADKISKNFPPPVRSIHRKLIDDLVVMTSSPRFLVPVYACLFLDSVKGAQLFESLVKSTAVDSVSAPTEENPNFQFLGASEVDLHLHQRHRVRR